MKGSNSEQLSIHDNKKSTHRKVFKGIFPLASLPAAGDDLRGALNQLSPSGDVFECLLEEKSGKKHKVTRAKVVLV